MAQPSVEPPFSLQEFCFHCGYLFETKDLLRSHLHSAYSLHCPELTTQHRCWICDIYIHNRDPIEGIGPLPRTAQQQSAAPRDPGSAHRSTGGNVLPPRPGTLHAGDTDPRPLKNTGSSKGATVKSPVPATTARPVSRPPLDEGTKRELNAGLNGLSRDQQGILSRMVSQHCDISQCRGGNGSVEMSRLPLEVQWMMVEHVRAMVGRQRKSGVNGVPTPTSDQARIQTPGGMQASTAGITVQQEGQAADRQAATSHKDAVLNLEMSRPTPNAQSAHDSPGLRSEQVIACHELPPLAPVEEEKLKRTRENWMSFPNQAQSHPNLASQAPISEPRAHTPSTSPPAEVLGRGLGNASPVFQANGSSTFRNPFVSGNIYPSSMIPGNVNVEDIIRRRQVQRQIAEQRATEQGFSGAPTAQPTVPPAAPTARMQPENSSSGLRRGSITDASFIQKVPSAQIAANRYTLGQEQARLQPPSPTQAAPSQRMGFPLDPALMGNAPQMVPRGDSPSSTQQFLQ